MRNRTVKIPISLNFDLSNLPIGWVEIEKKYIKYFPRMTLSIAFIPDEKGNAKKLTGFGLVASRDYVDAVKKLFIYKNMNSKAREIIESFEDNFDDVFWAEVQQELNMGDLDTKPFKKFILEALHSYGEAMVGELPGREATACERCGKHLAVDDVKTDTHIDCECGHTVPLGWNSVAMLKGHNLAIDKPKKN